MSIDQGSLTTYDQTVYLTGRAFISPTYYRCCSGAASDTGVEVALANQATGGGTIRHYAWYCSLFGTRYLCDHVWAATVDLAIGLNVITVSAWDPGGNYGAVSIAVTRLRDSTPPAVTATNPVNGAPSVPVNVSLTATFSEALDPASVAATSFTLTDGAGSPVPGTVAFAGYSNNQLRFTPSAFLPVSTTFTATITSDVQDTSGNPLTAPYAWTFTTSATTDITAPSVSATDPADGSTCFPVDGSVRATFNEAIDAGSVDPSTFLLSDASGSVSGSASLGGDSVTASFAPYGGLANATTYTATLSGQIHDLAGNALGTNHSWSFTTAPPGIGTWQATSRTGAPSMRSGYTAVWSGSEMIVWGGQDASATHSLLGDGARYDPVSDAWTPVSPAGAPTPRSGHIAVWTGSEMIVWGGIGSSGAEVSGAIYSPATDSWRPMSATGAPSARTSATAVWTGTEMIVWGGLSVPSTLEPPMQLGDGARYDPASDTWKPLSSANAPEPRYSHTAVWTGSHMIVWGGFGWTLPLNTGAAYDPASDTWQVLPTAGAPESREGHSATWTGSEMIVWGGHGASGALDTGGRYDPSSGTWSAMSSQCPASARYGHSAVWTGSELVVWGGSGATLANVGARYDPALDRWRPMSVADQPRPGFQTGPALWTGAEVVIWGGGSGQQTPVPGYGGRYRP